MSLLSDPSSFSISSHFLKQPERPTIATHDGTFHCDEALACYMLKLTEKFQNADIVRTRNPEILAQVDCLVDVGAVFDPATFRFDHHQASFVDTFSPEYKSRLSSAGLVYKYFGKEVIGKLIAPFLDSAIPASELASTVDIIYEKVYKNFIEHLDAMDNGQEVSENGKLLYVISTHLGARIARLNPEWNEPSDDVTISNRFRQAMMTTGDEFSEFVASQARSWLPAREIVEKAINARLTTHPSGKIIQLDTFCPWKEHVFSIERALGIEGQIVYVLYPDKSGTWRVQCVPADENAMFSCRVALPTEWRGVRDEALSEKLGVPGAVFVHASGFIGGHKTLEGVIKMAEKGISSQ